MAENRIKRDNDTRETKSRKRHWVKPDVLPSIEVEAGYETRWVRISTLGVTDASNVSSKLREGWEPVKAEDYPEILSDNNERFEGNITQGGLLLCKAPKTTLVCLYSTSAAQKLPTLVKVIKFFVKRLTSWLIQQSMPPMG